MDQDRRNFLKTTGLTGTALLGAAAGLADASPARAKSRANGNAARNGGNGGMAKNMSFATLRQPSGRYTLGLRSDRGVLDVAKVEHDFHENAPTTIDDVIHG